MMDGRRRSALPWPGALVRMAVEDIGLADPQGRW